MTVANAQCMTGAEYVKIIVVTAGGMCNSCAVELGKQVEAVLEALLMQSLHRLLATETACVAYAWQCLIDAKI